MRAALVTPLLLMALSFGATAARADLSERETLADHTPGHIPEEGMDADMLLAQGQAAMAMSSTDFPLAAQSYCLAARMGNAEGQYRLGRLLLQQRGLPRARAEAAFLLRLAADQGHEDAKLLIASGTAFGGQTPLRPTCYPAPAVVAQSDASTWVPPSFDPKAKPVSAVVVERYLKQLDTESLSWARRVQERAPVYGIDPRLAVSVVRAESNFNPRALSPANAHGLMQLIPATAQRFGVSDLNDPAQNIEGGLAYLRWLLLRFNHDVLKTTAAYNAGEGAVDRYQGVPPYPETRAYVERIMGFYRASVHQAPPPPKPQRIRVVKSGTRPRS